MENLKPTEISQRTGIPQSTISKYLLGQRVPSRKNLEVLRLFGYDLEPFLFGRDRDRMPRNASKETEQCL